MGSWFSHTRSDSEEMSITNYRQNMYKYPPKTGSYFGSYFIMGGERFDTIQPETFLFGDNKDLNFLGNRPIPFPYPAPQSNEPIKTLKSLVNIRKDSLRFVRVEEDGAIGSAKFQSKSSSQEDLPMSEESVDAEVINASEAEFNIEFTFDCDVSVAITVMYFATEEISQGVVNYRPRDPKMSSETYRYKRGANQVFSQASHVIKPTNFSEEDWHFDTDKDVIPIIIQCVVVEEEFLGHSHQTFATVERNKDGQYSLKPHKQKQMVDGLCFLLQEIYGIENKGAVTDNISDDEMEESGSECAICLSDMRDTLILPCRHLCLCNQCANSLRYQSNNCPICRAPFRALLQIRALRKRKHSLVQGNLATGHEIDDCIPPGYEAVSLIEALNGPDSLRPNTVSPESTLQQRKNTSVHTSPEVSPLTLKKKNKRKNRHLPSYSDTDSVELSVKSRESSLRNKPRVERVVEEIETVTMMCELEVTGSESTEVSADNMAVDALAPKSESSLVELEDTVNVLSPPEEAKCCALDEPTKSTVVPNALSEGSSSDSVTSSHGLLVSN